MLNYIDPQIMRLETVYFFTAISTGQPDKAKRHKTYIRALESTGVVVINGKFKKKQRKCPSCHHIWYGKEEKETDVNIAVQLLSDAYQDKFDKAYLVSQDSDFLPVIRHMYANFPHKSVKIITPPNLYHSKAMASIVGEKNLATIKEINIQRSLFPRIIKDSTGTSIAERPTEYN